MLSTKVSQPEEVFESFREFPWGISFTFLGALGTESGSRVAMLGESVALSPSHLRAEPRAGTAASAVRLRARLALRRGLVGFLSEHVEAQLVPKRHRLLLNRASC